MSTKNTYDDDIVTGKLLSYFWKRLKNTFVTKQVVAEEVRTAIDDLIDNDGIVEKLFVDVNALPTENVDTNVFYRTPKGVFWYYGEWHQISEGSGGGGGSSPLPIITPADEGKILKVVDGEWAAADLPVYEGAYEITPSAENEQTLNTAQTFMDADVVVNKIPYAEVTNTSNGKTVTIG